jgi:uncharacterized repeat protein (TIGR01451 family)
VSSNGTGNATGYNSGGGWQWNDVGVVANIDNATPSCTSGALKANHTVTLSFTNGSARTIPANGGYMTEIRVQLYYPAHNGNFDPGCDDYSTIGTNTSYHQDASFAVYESGSLVCEYTNATTQDASTGTEPCGGNGCASPTSTPTPTISLTFTESPTFSSSPTFSYSPTESMTFTNSPSYTHTRTITPSSTATPTNSSTSTMTNTPVFSATSTVTPVMALTKTSSRSIATLGDTITFCMTWRNGHSAPVNIVIWDTVPATLSYQGCDSGCSQSGGYVTWNLGSRAAGATGTVCFWGTVNGYPWWPRWLDAQFAFLEQPGRRWPWPGEASRAAPERVRLN